MEAPKIFWSWQNDYAPSVCRHFIRDALVEAAAAAGQALGLEDAERPEVDHDTKDAPGMADIIATILEKISNSAVFVADLTPIGTSSDGKALPNPNVLIELGWALRSLGPEAIIAVLNTASGFKPDDLPFDIRHRRALPYELAKDADSSTRATARKRLVASLTYALKTNLGVHIDAKVAAQDIEGVPAKPDNPSVWATATENIESHDSFVTGHKQSVAFPDCPRAYIRIIPAGWGNGPPSVSDVARLADPLIVWPPLEGGGSGNYGVCEEGFVRYWYTGGDERSGLETRNVTMFFDQTGEFWTVFGTAIGERSKGGTALRNEAVIRSWGRAIRTALAVFKKFEAAPVCKVEAGLFGVRDVRWPGTWESESPPARKNHCVARRQHRDWTEDVQIEFLTEAYTKVRDLFGLPRATAEDVTRIVGQPM